MGSILSRSSSSSNYVLPIQSSSSTAAASTAAAAGSLLSRLSAAVKQGIEYLSSMSMSMNGGSGSVVDDSTSLAEVRNETSERLMLCQRHRDVWSGHILELEPSEAKGMSHEHLSGLNTFQMFEFLVVTASQGSVRSVPPICIDPCDFLHYRSLVIRNTGARFYLHKIPR